MLVKWVLYKLSHLPRHTMGSCAASVKLERGPREEEEEALREGKRNGAAAMRKQKRGLSGGRKGLARGYGPWRGLWGRGQAENKA